MTNLVSMETWNTGPFDNDEAAELIEDIREGVLDPLELLPSADSRYLDADEGAMIVAMAHVAAGNLPAGLDSAKVKTLQTPETKERLRQALEAVLSDSSVSGLAEQWAKAGESQWHEWKAKSHVDLS